MEKRIMELGEEWLVSHQTRRSRTKMFGQLGPYRYYIYKHALRSSILKWYTPTVTDTGLDSKQTWIRCL